MSTQNIARIVSIVLGPQVWFPVIFLVLIFKTNLDSQQTSILLPIAFFVICIVPMLYIYFALRFKFATSWELLKKEERYPFMVVTLFFYLILFFFINIFGPKLLKDISLVFLTSLVPIYAITYFWKVSMHVALNTFCVIVINFLFGWSLPWLYLFIPLVAWARLELKRHTLGQLIVGFLVTAFTTLLGLKILGLGPHLFDIF